MQKSQKNTKLQKYEITKIIPNYTEKSQKLQNLAD
jgi:hypothetical protein